MTDVSVVRPGAEQGSWPDAAGSGGPARADRARVDALSLAHGFGTRAGACTAYCVSKSSIPLRSLRAVPTSTFCTAGKRSSVMGAYLTKPITDKV